MPESDAGFSVHSMFRQYRVSFVDAIAPQLAAQAVGGACVVVDRALIELHGARLDGLLDPGRVVAIDATEENKGLDTCRLLLEALVDRGFRRDGKLIAIGGGIIQDITAFSASILYRGVEWIFVPTTLLAQADSCLGSKTSINLGDKKNLLGNFYPPSLILIDTAFLETLSVEDVKSGIGEMLHFFYYADSPMVQRLVSEYDALILDRARLLPYIHESLLIKKGVAEKDEFDRGERNKFNYGHTFGHALESATRYSICHGLAVTVGMDLANYLSVRFGRMTTECFNGMHAVLRRNLPDADLDGVDLERYFAALSKDKKNLGTDLVCILASAPGKLEKVRLPFGPELREMISGYYQGRVWAQERLVTEVEIQ
jgi:3-dehydroquinate synthase